jgi:ABC-type multidrug transport system fused ATPase/permease subunit
MRRFFDPDYPQAPEGPSVPMRDVYLRILRHMRGFWKGIASGIGLATLGSIFIVLQPWPIKYAIDGAFGGRGLHIGPLTLATHTVHERIMAGAFMAGAYLVVTVVGVLIGAASFYVFARVALEMIHDLRGRLVFHMRSLGLRFHANQSVGESIWRAINDARSIQEVMIYGVQTWTRPILQLGLMVVLMLTLDPLLTVIALAVIPPLAFTIHRLTGRIQQTAAESRERMGRLTALIEQSLVAIRAVQVFGREAREQDRFLDTSRGFIRAQLRFRGWEQAMQVVTVSITGVGTAAILLVASQRVISGALTVGSLWVFVSYMSSLYNMMNQIMFVYGPFQDAVVGVGRAFQVLDEVPEIQEAPDAIEKPTFTSSIRFRDVHFSYETDRPVLHSLDLEITRGEKLAIVGETGSGKTTILSLIPRLYDVTSGAIEIDGADVRKLKVSSLRNLISMVPQEPLLFSATLKDNILYGRLDASFDDVQRASEAARAHGFIHELPAGYETEAGERGVKLSMGQQQRISIARAFLKDAPILLLDEPTSALDLRTESDFLEGLADLMVGRTVVIVAHRLSTIRNVDRICFLEDGRVAEQGSHDELIAAHGRYYELWTRQFAGAEPVMPVPDR